MKRLWMGLISLIISSNASARWLSMDEAPTVILKLGMDFSVRKDGTFDQEILYVLKVQSEDAKTNASTFTIDYNAATDEVEVLEAFTKNGSRKFPVDKTAIEDRDKGESRDYDVMRVRSVVYPQVQMGSELHIRYRMKTIKPLIKDRWSTQFSFAPSVHVKDLKIKVESEVPLYFETNDPKGLLKVSGSGKRLAVTNKKTLPGWVHAEKDVFFHPAGASEVWISTEKNWSPFLSGIEKDYAAIIGVGVPAKLKPWVTEAAKKKTEEDKIKYTLEKISEAFRYFGDWRRHDGGYTPRPLSEIESSRYGDCKDLSALLVAIFREMGLDASLALVRRGENPYGAEPDYKLPATNRFNHAIVRVKSNGKSYWLDPTNPVASLVPNSDISGRPAWVMSDKGGAFERLPEPQAADFEHVHQYAFRFKSDENVDVSLKASLKNLAASRISNELMLMSKSEVLTNTLDYFTGGAEVLKFEYKKEPRTDRILKDVDIALDYTAGQVAYNAGKSKFFVIPDGVLEGSFYETENRQSDLRLGDSPFTFKSNWKLVATQLAQEAPATCRIQSEWIDMERKVRSEGADVVIEQRLDLKRPFITRDEYKGAAFKKLQTEAKRCFHRAGILIQSGHG